MPPDREIFCAVCGDEHPEGQHFPFSLRTGTVDEATAALWRSRVRARSDPGSSRAAPLVTTTVSGHGAPADDLHRHSPGSVAGESVPDPSTVPNGIVPLGPATRRGTDLTTLDGEDQQGAATLNATLDDNSGVWTEGDVPVKRPHWYQRWRNALRRRTANVSMSQDHKLSFWKHRARGWQGESKLFAAMAECILKHLRGASTHVRETTKIKDLVSAMERQSIFTAHAPESYAASTRVTDTARVLFYLNVWFRPGRNDISLANAETGTQPFGDFARRAASRGSFNTSTAAELGAFSPEDLDIATLQTVGELSIEWTCYASEHLKLVSGSSERDDASRRVDDSDDERDEIEEAGEKSVQTTTLKIFWFDSLELAWLVPALVAGWSEEDAKLLGLEIIRTWSFLFHHRSQSQSKRTLKAYKRLPLPLGAHDYLADVSGQDTNRIHNLGDVLSHDLDKYLPVIRQKHLHPNMQLYNAQKHDAYRYSLFKVYGHRIRALRRHMDKKKPRGLRQLWFDSRDSLNYYTFWGVIVFGLTSVLLAVLSVVTGVVQAWASVKALQLSSST